MDMPPKEPLIYRLYEIIQNYGYAYKAILNEKFGDGIMSAISFSTKVEKEVDKDGNTWAVITLRGKWYVVFSFGWRGGSVAVCGSSMRRDGCNSSPSIVLGIVLTKK